MATNTKGLGQKAKNAAAASDDETIVISWVENQYSKFAGNHTLRAYRDPVERHKLIELRDPTTATKEEPLGQKKPYVILGGKTMKLYISKNPWHMAVYKFIIGNTEEEGQWRGHPRFNPGKKIFTIENVTEKAKKNNLNRKQIRALQTKVETMNQDALMQFGLLFGFDGKELSYDDVLDGIEAIIETPADNSESFFTCANVKEAIENPDFDYIVLVAVLKHKKVFISNDGVYKYNGATIAVTDDQLVKWLKDNSTVYMTLKEKYLAQTKVEEPDPAKE